MLKLIKKVGNGLVIRITKEDKDILNLKEGDLVDIEICKSNKKVNMKEKVLK